MEISWGDVAKLISAGVATLTMLGTIITSLYRWAKAQAKSELLADDATETIADLEQRLDARERENRRLWRLLETRSCTEETQS